MKIAENKSQVWFKILTAESRDINNEMKKWPLPDGAQKTEWVNTTSSIGTWLVSDPKEFMQRTNRAFIAELSEEEPLIELPGIIWVGKVRLVREATNLDLKRFGIHRAFEQVL